jgi:hypothetical protein
METKFKVGGNAVYQGNAVKVLAASKNFSSGALSYRIEHEQGQTVVNESELEYAEGESPETPEADSPEAIVEAAERTLKAEYANLYGQGVPKKHTKDLVWIQAEVDKIKNKLSWEMLAVLNSEQLAAFIVEKELDIDVNDYANVEDLLIAVAEVLEITKPL